MANFFLPERFLSDRTTDLVNWMEGDLQGFYDYIDWLYSYISIDSAVQDYIDDVAEFLGIGTLKTRYAEENQVKFIKNFFGIVKYLGSIKSIYNVLRSYSFSTELKYLWTDDWATYQEFDVTDLDYNAGKPLYLSSILLIRLLLGGLFSKVLTPITDYLASTDFFDHTDYYQDMSLQSYMSKVYDSAVAQNVYTSRAGRDKDGIYVVDIANTFGGTGSNPAYFGIWHCSYSVRCSAPMKVRSFLVGEVISTSLFPARCFGTCVNKATSPNDLTGTSWTKVNASSVLETSYVYGNRITTLYRNGVSSSAGVKKTLTGVVGSGIPFQCLVRKGTGGTFRYRVYDNTAVAVRGSISVNWATGSSIIANGATDLRTFWVDATTLWISGVANAVIPANNNTLEALIDVTSSGLGSSVLLTAMQYELGTYSKPFLAGTRVPYASTRLWQMPTRFTLQLRFSSWFPYSSSSTKTLLCWRYDATHFLKVYYDPSTDKFTVSYSDGTATAYLTSRVYATSDPLRSFHELVLVIDTSSSATSAGKLYTKRYGELSFTEDDSAWDVAPDIRVREYLNAYLGANVATEYADSEVESVRVYDGLATLAEMNAEFPVLLTLFEYPRRSNSPWRNVTGTAWVSGTDVISDPFPFYPKALGIEGHPIGSAEFSTESLKLLPVSFTKNFDKALMETELYQSLQADVDRFRMVHQVFNYQAKLSVSVLARPFGWEEINPVGIWLWKNETYFRTSFLSDTGLKADEGWTSDSVLSSVLDTFFKCKFGKGAIDHRDSLTPDVVNTLFSVDGDVTIDINASVYELNVFIEAQTFTFVNEMSVEDSVGNVLFYLTFPNIEKTGSKIYFYIRLDYSSEA